MRKKILIVDDEPEITTVLRNALEPLGHQVRICDTGLRVMDDLRAYKPDLVIMDVMLPGIDGYSLVSKFLDGDDAAFNKLPVIMISGLETSRCMFDRFTQVAAFFTKPFNVSDLVDAVNAVFTEKE